VSTVLSYGAGSNSKAILAGKVERSEPLDATVFSDTGGERPEIYADIALTSAWCVSKGYPPITTVKRIAPVKIDGEIKNAYTLEEECLMRKQLPSIAYGFKSCSDKWKQQPFKAWLKESGLTDVTVLIGFDADEPHRAERGDSYDSGYAKRYPLIEWGWNRDDCIAAIARSGLAQPGKSSCFFCPSSRKAEIIALPQYLKDRAVAMEQNANLTSVKGLGRRFAWADLLAAVDAQTIIEFPIEVPCGCHDGIASTPAITPEK
jgi:hypothetical protein